MEYFNMILENALMEVFEKHSGEIIGQLNIKLNCEDLKEAMHDQTMSLLEEILHYIENSNDKDYYKVEKIRKMLVESGIHCRSKH